MGAASVFNVISGNTVNEAFNNAVENSIVSDGNGGYSGCIAEAEYWEMFPIRSVGISSNEAIRLANAETVSYGPTLISPIIDEDTLGKAEKKVRLPIAIVEGAFGDMDTEDYNKIIVRFIKANPDVVVMDDDVVDVTKKGTGPVITEKKAVVFIVSASENRHNNKRFTERKLAMAYAKELARMGIGSSMSESAETIFLPLVERKFEMELTVRKVIGSTKAVPNEWFAMGCYRE